MNPDSYEINFTIPRGNTGETGPTGPAQIKAYGGIYSDTANSINIQNITTPNSLTMTKRMPTINVTLDNTFLRIEENGIYEITYGCTYIALNTNLKEIKVCNLSIYANNTEIPGSFIQNLVQNAIENNSPVFGSMNNTIVTKLNAGDQLSLMFGSTTPGTISFQPVGVNAMLFVKKIDD